MFEFFVVLEVLLSWGILFIVVYICSSPLRFENFGTCILLISWVIYIYSTFNNPVKCGQMLDLVIT